MEVPLPRQLFRSRCSFNICTLWAGPGEREGVEGGLQVVKNMHESVCCKPQNIMCRKVSKSTMFSPKYMYTVYREMSINPVELTQDNERERESEREG